MRADTVKPGVAGSVRNALIAARLDAARARQWGQPFQAPAARQREPVITRIASHFTCVRCVVNGSDFWARYLALGAIFALIRSRVRRLG